MTPHPLANRRILVTRARGQASVLAQALQAVGAEPILIPTIELAPPQSWCALDAALAAIHDPQTAPDWLLFTSTNAVHAFAARACTLSLQPSPRRIAVIGPATAAAVRETRLADRIDLVPPRYIAESFAEALLPHAPGASMLLVRAAIARDLLPEALTAAGAQVTLAEAYRTIVPPASIAALRELFTSSPPDSITFTSASTAQNLATLLESAALTLPQQTVLASIGPITSQAMRYLGLAPTVEAAESTIPGLVQSLVRYFAKR